MSIKRLWTAAGFGAANYYAAPGFNGQGAAFSAGLALVVGDTPGVEVGLCGNFDAANDLGWRIGLTPAGAIFFECADTGGSVERIVSPDTAHIGQAVHVMAKLDGLTMSLILNGIGEVTALLPNGFAPASNANGYRLGSADGLGNIDSSAGITSGWFHNSVLSPSQVRLSFLSVSQSLQPYVLETFGLSVLGPDQPFDNAWWSVNLRDMSDPTIPGDTWIPFSGTVPLSKVGAGTGVGINLEQIWSTSFTNPGGGGGVPAHAPTHEAGGVDPVTVENLQVLVGGAGEVLTADGVGGASFLPLPAPGNNSLFFGITANAGSPYPGGAGSTYILIDVGSNADFNMNLGFPDDFGALVALELIGIAQFTDAAAADIDFSSDYGAVGEQYDTHSGSIAGFTPAVVDGEIFAFDISAAFAAAAAGDVAGLLTDHNMIGGTLGYIGIRLEYTPA